MAKKRKKKDAPARAQSRSARTRKRGMYLEVVVADRNGGEFVQLVESFRDITAAGHRAAAMVRAYLRTIPLSPHTAAYSLHVYPRWVETAAPPVGKRGAGELEDVADGRD